MKNAFGMLPLYVRVCALCVGVPLVFLGCMLTASDLNEMIRLHSLSGTQDFDFIIGPIFALVGISFLWPVRPFRTHH